MVQVFPNVPHTHTKTGKSCMHVHVHVYCMEKTEIRKHQLRIPFNVVSLEAYTGMTYEFAVSYQ